ncbi:MULTISPECIES: hypothetical protein [Streptomyces]|uniref:hypothetical protein n=1 Tax=Streptomyces TaxID=1883 RepID=UPI0003A33467|nr:MULTISPECIES: hypothetical protein [Streptomyces]MBZ6111087.1 hypothetical protein [Streptomyces olivaceus]MBZ6127647.1 hypothetical protein [Streptomyces olivaceus]MBZ6145423.1 hypothetical protein [Streptomyces olivaceus]MBZ6159571.1 hypothetical protein [Streptomyces olivaceus]MBZ6187348.1 hypothetical protein [Streptomyces olivaceus]
MRLPLRVVLWTSIAFNLAQTAVLAFAPEVIDRAYLGGEMTPTRRFQWYAVAGYHVLIIAVTVIAMGLERAADRRRLVVVNALMYILWDAASQLAYWGGVIGMATSDLLVNSGVSIAGGAALLVVAWRDRDAGAAPTR